MTYWRANARLMGGRVKPCHDSEERLIRPPPWPVLLNNSAVRSE